MIPSYIPSLYPQSYRSHTSHGFPIILHKILLPWPTSVIPFPFEHWDDPLQKWRRFFHWKIIHCHGQNSIAMPMTDPYVCLIYAIHMVCHWPSTKTPVLLAYIYHTWVHCHAWFSDDFCLFDFKGQLGVLFEYQDIAAAKLSWITLQ